MRRRDWPTVEQLARRLGHDPAYMLWLAIALAPDRQAYMHLSHDFQKCCWRVNPKAIAARLKKRRRCNRPPGPSVNVVPIQVTIHIPEALLKRLFGSGSKGD